jgi:hypothetical protein
LLAEFIFATCLQIKRATSYLSERPEAAGRGAVDETFEKLPAFHSYGKIYYDSNGVAHSAAASYAQVYAYAAQPSGGSLGSPLFTATTHGPGAVKFAVPTVADGKLFLAGGNNNPFYSPGSSNCPASNPTNCGMLVIWH